MDDEEKNYIERHRQWQNQAINQLSIANNFLLTISAGLLAFIFDKDVIPKIKFSFDICSSPNSIIFYSYSLLFIIISIGTGIIVLITRLYDFRITKHTTLIRKRFYQENIKTKQNKAKLSHSEFSNPNFWQRCNSIYEVLFAKIEFLTESEMTCDKDKFPKDKFNNLRELSFRLGIISLKWTKLQALYFFISVLLYSLYLWAK